MPNRSSFALMLVALTLAACTDPVPRTETFLEEERFAARTILAELQVASIAENSEFCGMLLRDRDGALFRSAHFRGSADQCEVSDVPDIGQIVASYHTHGAYLPGYDNEVPSVQDLKEDMDWGIDGYVSTPGGRFWHVDGRAGTVTLICGLGCLPSDPRYRDQSALIGPIRSQYDLPALERRAQLEDRVR